MPDFCVEKIAGRAQRGRQPVRGSRIAILGVSYKAGVGDVRESPALKIMQLLAERGADLSYHDPYVPELSASVWLAAARGGARDTDVVASSPCIPSSTSTASWGVAADRRLPRVTSGRAAERVVRL